MTPKNNIAYWRRKRNLSQERLAQLCSMSQSYLSELEINLKMPSIKMLYIIASVLEVCPKALIGCIIECKNCCMNNSKYV